MGRAKKLIACLLLAVTVLGSALFAYAAEIEIVNPQAEVYGDSILISVKVTDKATVRVSAFEQKKKVKLTKEQFAAAQKADKNAKDYKLVSITDSAESIAKEDIESVAVMEAEKFVPSDKLQFYSKKLSDIKPGLYKITAEVLDAKGKVTQTKNQLVFVQAKEKKDAVVFDNATKTPKVVTWIQNLFKNLFGA